MSVHIAHNDGRIKITFRSQTVQINEDCKKFIDPNFGSKPVGPTSELGGGGNDLERGYAVALKTPFSRLSHSLQDFHFKQTSKQVNL